MEMKLEKKCPRCGEVKDRDKEFHKRKSRKNGVASLCKECSKKKTYAYRKENPSVVAAIALKFREKHREEAAAKSRLWRRNNPERTRQLRRNQMKRILADKSSQAYAAMQARGMLRRLVRAHGCIKSGKTEEILGYTFGQFKMRIESNFLPGMSWENHGEWHVDHTIPVIHFINKNEHRPSIINALCNLRPMWADDNMKKGAKHPIVRGTKH